MRRPEQFRSLRRRANGLFINAHLRKALRTQGMKWRPRRGRGDGIVALENIEAEDKWLEQEAWKPNAKKNVD